MNEKQKELTGRDQWVVFKRLLVYLIPHKKMLSVAMLLLILTVLGDVLGPLIIKTFIDGYLTPGNFPTGPVTGLALGAVLVDYGDVAGVVPAAVEGLGGLLGLVPVAGHDVGTLDDDLTGHPGRDGPAVEVHHLVLSKEVGTARRSRLGQAVAGFKHADAGAGFGHPEALHDGNLLVLPGPDGPLRQRRAAHHEPAHCGQVRRREGRIAAQGVEHGRYQERRSYPGLFHLGQHGRGLERPVDDDAPAQRERGQGHHVQPGDTLWTISQKYDGISVDKIKKLNKLKSNQIKPGQKLILG